MPTSLPLTAFERLMLLDDSDKYPRLSFGRVLFEGQLDRAAFESALVATLEDHWLIRSTVSNGLRKRWIVGEAEVPPIQWLQGPTGGPLQTATRINLHRETGVRLVVVQDNMHVEITFIIHHACCDGVGGLRFCEDVLCHYAVFQAGSELQVASKSVEAERNYERSSSGLTFQNARSVLPKQIVGVLGALQYCFRNPKPLGMLKPGDSEHGDHDSFPATTVLECTRDHTVELRKAARNSGVSQNELLARDFFLALWDWQKSEGSFDESAWLRMMIPINMRDASSRTLPAMNAVSSVFLDRRARDSASEEQLLNSIRDEMEVIRKFDLRYTFL